MAGVVRFGYWCSAILEKMSREESASESAFSDAEDRPPTQRKRQRSVNEMFKSMEGKKKRVTSPRQHEPVSSDFRAELKSLIAESIESAVCNLWQKN